MAHAIFYLRSCDFDVRWHVEFAHVVVNNFGRESASREAWYIDCPRIDTINRCDSSSSSDLSFTDDES